jgi:hypothetical protein
MAKARNILFHFVAGGLLAALLTACGSSSNGTTTATTPAAVAPAATLAGTLTDAPVVGAGYFTSTGSGGCLASTPCATTAQGQFKYAAGDTVTFTAAGVTLGTTAALQPSTDGSTTITPVGLVAGATAPTDPGPTAIAQFLQTLSTLAAGTSGSGAAGVLTMPTDASTTGKLKTALTGAGVISTASVATVVSQLQTVINAAFGANQFAVVPASTAQAALTQGVNSNSIIGTVWSGTCTCGVTKQVTFYFQPGGTLTGFTDDGNLLAGSWAGSTISGGGVTIQISSPGGKYATGIFNSTTGTVTAYTATGAVDGTVAFTKIVALGTSAAINTQYLGGWYATYLPNAASIKNGDTGGTAYIVAAPDGTFYGVTDGSSNAFKGTWTTANGQGTATWTEPAPSCTQNCTTTISIDLANANGTVSNSGTAAGTLTLSRTGALTRNNNSGSAIPLLLNVVVSWANVANTVNSFGLGLNVFDSTGKLVSSSVKSESTAPRYDGVRTTTTDNIAVPYPTSGGSTYKLSVGTSNCAIDGSGGSVIDANSGNASLYPTVYVTCDASATVQPIPLLLFVTTTWGTSFPKGSVPGYGLALAVKDASGSQIAAGFVQQNQVMSGSTFTITNSIAASYPTGGGVTYALTTGSAYCSITGGGSGNVNDLYKSKPALYPTVTVSCP